jgi:NADH:ubiquinone oxidoreductase subunit 3 (subunit A)
MGGWDGLVIMIAVGIGFGAVSIVLGRVLGPRHPTPEKWRRTSAACLRSATRASGSR